MPKVRVTSQIEIDLDEVLQGLARLGTKELDPTLTVDGHTETYVILFFPIGYGKIPRTRVGKKRQPRYMGYFPPKY